MPTIGAAVDEDTKARFEAEAAARGLTASKLSASLIVKFLQDGGLASTSLAPPLILPPPAPRPEHAGPRTQQVFVRLEPHYYDQLGRLANERAWARGTYMANLFYVHVDRDPRLCDTEINAVRQVARQLADLGRNVNQIARKLNSSMDDAHLAMGIDLDVLHVAVDLAVTLVKDLMAANLKGWAD